MSLTAQINGMAEYLEDSEKMLVIEIMKRFIPDDVATPEDLQDIAIANRELAEGRTTSFNDVNWD